MKTIPLSPPCPECDVAEATESYGCTMIGYIPVNEHLHDPNHWYRSLRCTNGHEIVDPSPRHFSRPCPACGWRKLECCGKKLEPLPEEYLRELPEMERRAKERYEQYRVPQAEVDAWLAREREAGNDINPNIVIYDSTRKLWLREEK